MKAFFTRFALPPEQRGGVVLLLLALTTAAAAQMMLLLSYFEDPAYWDMRTWLLALGNNTTPLPGLALYVLAGTLLILSLRTFGWRLPALPEMRCEAQSAPTHRFGFWLTAFGLGILAANYAARPVESQENGYALALTWILSLGLFGYSVLNQSGWQMPNRDELRAWWKQNRLEVVAVLFLLALAALFRAYNVERIPYSMVNDEGEMGKGALCLLRGECRNIFAIAWASQPYVAYLPYALSVGLFGHDAAAPVRLVSVVTGVLAVLFLYLFAREAFGKPLALSAGVILAVLPYHIHFSRLGVDNIADSLSSGLMLWLVWRAMRSGVASWYLLAGIVSGLCFYTYPGSRLAPALGLLMWGWAAVTRRGFLRTHSRGLALWLAAAFLTVAPLLGTYQSNPEFNQRLESVGLLQGNRLQEEMAYTGLSAAQVLTMQFFKSFLVFINTGGPFQFFSSPRAYFSPIAAVFLMSGLAIAIWKFHDLRVLALLAWFFAPLVFGSALTVGPPSNQRMLGSAPAAALLTALGLLAVAQALSGLKSFLRHLSVGLVVVVLLLDGWQNTRYYFVEYQQGHFFEDLNNEITYESRMLIRSLQGSGRLFLIGEPMTRVHYGNFGYFNPDVEKYDFNPSPEALNALPKDRDALFLAIPSREAELRRIAEQIPGGVWIAEQRRNQPEYPLYFAYKVSKEQLQSYRP